MLSYVIFWGIWKSTDKTYRFFIRGKFYVYLLGTPEQI